jgi:hypothetical protein
MLDLLLLLCISVHLQSSSTSPLSRFNSCIAAVTSPKISCMGLEADKMPGLNGWTICLSAKVVTQVCFKSQYKNHNIGEELRRVKLTSILLI